MLKKRGEHIWVNYPFKLGILTCITLNSSWFQSVLAYVLGERDACSKIKSQLDTQQDVRLSGIDAVVLHISCETHVKNHQHCICLCVTVDHKKCRKTSDQTKAVRKNNFLLFLTIATVAF